MSRSLVLVMLAGCGRLGFDGVVASDARTTYPEAVLADRPVGYWRLGDPARFVDEVGGPDGVAVGSCQMTVAGLIADDSDTAIQFGETCMIDLGDPFPFVGRAPFSVEAWVASEGATTDFIVTRQVRNGDNTPAEGYALLDSAIGVYFERAVASANRITPRTNIPSAKRTHLVGTYDGVVLHVFVDGIDTGASEEATEDAVPTPAPVLIGGVLSDLLEPMNRFKGTIDEVAIYDHVLPAVRVQRHYQIGTGQD